MLKSKIRVLIVDDSPFVRKAVRRILDSDAELEMVGEARNGKEVIDLIASLKPDVLTLDVMMPEMDGIETLRKIMETSPIPVLMLSQFTHEGADLTLKALDLGAMDFVDKSSTGLMDFGSLTNEIVTKLKAIAFNKPKQLLTGPKIVPITTASKGLVDVVAIAASTGGPPALQMVLQKFPKDISFGIVIVQHMAKGFTAMLANRLNGLCNIAIKEAVTGDPIVPGTALIAPSGFHMTVEKNNTIKIDTEPTNTIHRPSADVLFKSVASVYGKRSIGVIMTGMGSDGAINIGDIQANGGKTFAQDEATCAIFGMPRVAILNGFIDKVLPVGEIADEILRNV